MEPASIILVDASIYLYRAWQQWPASTDSSGRPCQVLAGFVETLGHLLTHDQPSHLLCALDTCGRHGRRNELFPAYKRSRPPAPAALADQLARTRPLCEALGITALGSSSVEADDIIGHFAELARAAGRPVVIVSGDKDLAQFVGPDDVWHDVGRHERQTYRVVERRLGVRPEHIPDWLALCGDKSDGIPGVPGVGPATAARLIRKWGSLDVLYTHLDEVAAMRFRGAPGVARLLAEHEAGVRKARLLTGLIEDPDLPVRLAALQRRTVDADTVRQVLIDAGIEPRRAVALGNRFAWDNTTSCNGVFRPAGETSASL